MATERSDTQAGGRWSSESTYRDLKKEIAERNEQAHKEARELRAARERRELGIVSRRLVDIDR
jgi:hypothetical protein